MTRQHFEAIATAFAASRPTADQFTTHSAVGNNTMTNLIAFDAAYASWTDARDRVMRAIARFNGAFDYGQFTTATEE